MLSAGLSLGAVASAAAAAGPRARETAGLRSIPAHELSLRPDPGQDQTGQFQAAIDRAALAGLPLRLEAGRYACAGLTLRPGSQLIGIPGRTRLESASGDLAMVGHLAGDVHLEGLVLGNTGATGKRALIDLRQCRGIVLSGLAVRGAKGHGISLADCSGRITDCDVTHAADAGIFSTDAQGLEIAHNRIADCGNNGILVWRSRAGEDGTIVAGNRIERIGAAAGGSGQNGNGINIFRAGGVLVTGNRIADCAYTAVRGNAASNIQIVGNSCARLGEVAVYAEFAFEGALIANNLIDGAACGISVTNFNEGGRLAVIQGNLVRNLRRREHEPVDKRGEGIAVEADAVVTGNVVENAPTAGLVIGWGRWMRDVVATANVIRHARVGIAVTADEAAGSCLIAGNMISGATEGAIRGMIDGRLVGPDLSKAPPATGRVAVSGNVAVERPV